MVGQRQPNKGFTLVEIGMIIKPLGKVAPFYLIQAQ
jgi:hypothetical protein